MEKKVTWSTAPSTASTPNAAMYFVVQAKNGDLIVVPDTPEGRRDFHEITDGKWKRLL
jgi:hypothetical protein